jgi:hypothetical protein
LINSTNLNYIAVIGAIAFFILPAWELITNTKKRGIKRITKIGWVMLFTAIFFGVVSVLSIHAGDVEKKIASDKLDSGRSADKNEFKKDVNDALKRYGLTIKSTSKTIVITDTVISIEKIPKWTLL